MEKDAETIPPAGGISRRQALTAGASFGLTTALGAFGSAGAQALSGLPAGAPATIAPTAIGAACTDYLVNLPSVRVRMAFSHGPSGGRWFAPGVARWPGGGFVVVMSEYISSDNFGPPHVSITSDISGCSWPTPTPLTVLANRPHPDDASLTEKFVGMLPSIDDDLNTLLLAGTSTPYSGSLDVDTVPRRVAYTTRHSGGVWEPVQYLAWSTPGPSGYAYTSMLQRVHEPDGSVIIPVQFTFDAAGATGPLNIRSTTLHCSFDGYDLAVIAEGTHMSLPPVAGKRGLLEPSVAKFGGQYFLTMRAEDGRAYYSTASDGLAWAAPQRWKWDSGAELITGSTQQHWLVRDDALFLVYTRANSYNEAITRRRLPIYMAQVDTTTLRLIRKTEMVVSPAMSALDTTSYSGNFSVTRNADDDEAFIMDAPFAGAGAGTFFTRLTWS